MTIQIQDVILKHGSLGYLNGRFEMMGDRVTFADLGLGGGQGLDLPRDAGTIRPHRSSSMSQTSDKLLRSQAGWMDVGWSTATCTSKGKFNDLWADPPLDGTLGRWAPIVCRK